MLKTNFHTHTYRCNHASGTEEELVLLAISKSMTDLGFSEHSPYPDDRFDLRMPYSTLDDYISTLQNLKAKYIGKINIFIGLEIEYDPAQQSYYEYLLNTLKIDYLALGQHIFIDSNGKFMNTYELTSTKDFITYANTICDAIKTGYFSFIAHPDVIFFNNFAWDTNCEKACDLIIDCAKKHNAILELNANGIRRGVNDFIDGKRYSYPHIRFWEKVSSANVKTIINSDCHNPKHLLDYAMEKAFTLSKELNLNLAHHIK